MDRRTLLASGAALAAAGPSPFGLASATTPAMTMPPAPPVAKKLPKRIEQLGRVRIDDYAWLKDENWQKVMRDPSVVRADIKAHLEAENAYTSAMLASTEGLQTTLLEEMKGRIREDDSTLPQPDGPFEYYSRYAVGSQYPIYARRPRGGGPEEVLIDADALAKGKPFFNVAAAEHSPDHAYFAYAVDEQGSEYHRIYVKDLATGETLAHPVENTEGDFIFSQDAKWLFWVFRDENARPSKVFRRPVRGGPANDVLVYHEPDEGMFVHLDRTRDRAFLIIATGDHETSDARLIPAADPIAEPRIVEPRTKGLRYDVDRWDGRLLILTNADGAIDFKLMTAPDDQPGRAHWTTLVPHRPGRYLMGVAPFKDHLVRLERADANHHIVITDRGDLKERPIPVSEEAYALALDPGYEYDTAVLRFVYQSPTTPRSWFDYDMASGARTLKKTQEIPSGHDPKRYVARRLFAKVPDGESVPITVLMKAGTPLDGTAPMLLYGYGSYGLSTDPTFSIRSLSLVDRGWIWAIAHVRGGSEKGWGWFLGGRAMTKKNTFTDFIACAEHLTAHGYGAKGRIVAYGGSAGGMLMGAITNLRPELWAGVIGAVPFVDVLNTMSDTSLPLTPPEWPEWGNPLTDPAAYDYIASYSPYDNVAAKPYPAILATGGLSDPRVTYWEPAKWAAKLRANTASPRPVLLRINMEAGHHGSAGRFESLKEVAREYAFAMRAIDPAFVAKA
jgi:oligopeptidase B